jgi:exopolyphosphatase/guanosine-5'-triphosphate,3'-diphosphate pyrophosphatase
MAGGSLCLTMPHMRVAVVDIGSNSIRLLVADVHSAQDVAELERRSVVTRLGHGVDALARLSPEAADRTFDVLTRYSEAIESLGCERNLAVLTSAVRDAANGPQFSERVRSLGLDAKVLTGDEEAQLTFLGATSDRPPSNEQGVVIDIGGGSTEFVVGHDHAPTFHTSLQAGVVRMSERHIATDPPLAAERQAIADDVREIFQAGLPASVRASVIRGIAVAGTATSAAAIDQQLDPYDPAKVHGYKLPRNTVQVLLTRLAGMDEAQRRQVPGLHPDRAPTIVAGMVLLSEAMGAFGLREVEVSEHDILRGGALKLAGLG